MKFYYRTTATKTRLYLIQSILVGFFSITAFFLTSCKDITQPQTQGVVPSSRGAYILCEGLWRQDNASLSRFDAVSGMVQNNVVEMANPGLRLGDTANDLVLKGDTMFVAVSTSRTIEIFRTSTAVWLGRIRFAGTRQEPRFITLLNDTTAFVTLLNDDSIQEFNPTTFALKGSPILVGPAPEGIASTSKYVFVANSGYGDFRASEPKAGTVSVIGASTRDAATQREIKLFGGVPNVRELLVSPDKRRLYAVYTHLLSQKDSLGGVVEYDTETLAELRRWHTKEPLSASLRNDSLFCLSANGVAVLPLKQALMSFATLFPAQSGNVWYSLAAHPTSGALWIGNAKNYQVNGEVMIMNIQGQVQQRFEVGINPNSLVFF